VVLRTVERESLFRPAHAIPAAASRHRGPGLNGIPGSFDPVPVARSGAKSRALPEFDRIALWPLAFGLWTLVSGAPPASGQ
jgi:hypothetical protein